MLNGPKQRKIRCFGPLFISLRVGSLSQEVVDGYIVEVSQTDQNVRGNVPLTQFVVAVDLLRAIQKVSQLALF